MKRMLGFTIIEALIASAVFGILTIGLVSGFLFGLESTALAGNRSRAILLAEEGIEAVRNMRDNDFVNLEDGTHGLTNATNKWAFSGTFDETDIFSRAIEVGTIDIDRKFVTSTVTWQQNPIRTGTVQIVSRLTNWLENTGSSGNWSSPAVETTISLSGNSNGIKIMGQGTYAYMVREGGSPDFIIFDVSNPASASEVGSLSLPSTPQNIYVSGDYAYVTSQSNNEELQIIDISTPSIPVVIGTYNDSGSEDAFGVFVSGDYAYLTFNGGNNIVSVDVTTPTAPTFASGINIAGGANEVFILGDYAYLASTDNSEELQVIDISSPTSLSQVGSLDLSSDDDVNTISGFGSTIVVGRTGGQFEVLDVSTPAAPTFSGSYAAGDAINDISITFIDSNAYAVLGLDDIFGEFRIIDITTTSTPVLYGIINQPKNLNGVWYDSFQDRVYGASDHNPTEFIVFKPF